MLSEAWGHRDFEGSLAVGGLKALGAYLGCSRGSGGSWGPGCFESLGALEFSRSSGGSGGSGRPEGSKCLGYSVGPVCRGFFGGSGGSGGPGGSGSLEGSGGTVVPECSDCIETLGLCEGPRGLWELWGPKVRSEACGSWGLLWV